MRLLLPFVFLSVSVLVGCERGEQTSDATTPQTDTTTIVDPPPASMDTTLSAPLLDATNVVAAPAFELKAMDGSRFRLQDTRGKVVVLNFWATWCPPCRQEIPDFVELQRELGPKGLQIVGVSLDEEGEAPVREYARTMPFNYPIMVDDGAVVRSYGPIESLPSTFIIDRKGNVRHFAAGMLTKEMLKPALVKLLAEKV